LPESWNCSRSRRLEKTAAPARDQHEQRPWQEPKRAAGATEQKARSRRIAFCDEVDSEMRARPRRRRNADRDEQCKCNLPEIVGFARQVAHEIAQRPLQEEQYDQWQRKPLRRGDEAADQAIERT
jgi:hypothetical protein